MEIGRILVDTSAYSLLKRGHADTVLAMQTASAIFVSPTVLGELRAGFAAGTRRDRNEAELDAFIDSPRVELLSIDSDTAVFYATIFLSLRKAGTPIPANDLWIAASAMQHGLCLLTADEHFRLVNQVIVRFLS